MGKIGPVVNDILSSDGTTVDIPVATTATVYTKSFSMKSGMYFALAYKAASGGNVKLKIELEESFQLPTTEGSSDTYWVTAEGASAIESALADTDQHIAALSPVTAPYGRIKITGLGDPDGNAATTKIRLRLIKQEDI